MKHSGPASLQDWVVLAAKQEGVPEAADEARLRAHLVGAPADDGLRKRLHLALAEWDYAPTDAGWSVGTAPNTAERRAAVYQALGLATETGKVLDELAPFAPDDTIVISREFEPWYTDAFQSEHAFYWEHYEQYLADSGWAPDAVASLDAATTRVMQRLARPTREEAYQAKGLVVGFVQSGKTANFTGVIAKAIDAGYRLVIVLAGTTNILRSQTQRRLDKELVGVENILRGIDPDDDESLAAVDYQGDPDWIDGEFVRHGVNPSEVGQPDILRLTTYEADYKKLGQGIAALDLERPDKQRPLYDPENLLRINARVIVMKKNKAPLEKFVNDLKKITAKRSEIPTLIIDDESDQASVNTTDPEKWKEGQKERTAINKLLSQLIAELPRAQYVAYTATPFANVFVDPSDAQDIFPRDFMFSLDRPPGYMGARDFHDLDNPVPEDERTVADSNERAHVRPITADDGDDGRLRDAIDIFVLTGAVKLFRQSHGITPEFRHHTLLIHESVKKASHKDQAERVTQLWNASAYNGTGLARLEKLFNEDVAPVSLARRPDMPMPASFAELKPYVSKAISNIESGTGNPVLVVNSDKELAQEAIDFEKRPVWKILVGGTKLSRGFTVEGLTVSYYRRKTNQTDTLMQMGRWFGFRWNYDDLVRLFIGTEEGASGTYDLYAAFEAACMTEERFRDQLKLYASLDGEGKPQITPKEIPPLVTQHLPWLRPAAPNKMFNAELEERRSPGEWIEPTGYPESPADIAANAEAFEALIRSASATEEFVHVEKGRSFPYDALVATASQADVVAVLKKLRWQPSDHFTSHLTWLAQLGDENVDDWVIMLPQHKGKGPRAQFFDHEGLSVFRRTRRAGRAGLFGGLSDRKHRDSAKRIAGALPVGLDTTADRMHQPKRGALVLYPVVEAEKDDEIPAVVEPGEVVVAFGVVAPAAARPIDGRLVAFRVRDPERAEDPIIDAA